MKRVCVLASGGVDSSVLVADLLKKGYQVSPLYMRSGLRWEDVEMFWVRRFLRSLSSRRLRPLTILDGPETVLPQSHWSRGGKRVPSASARWDSIYLPGRNLQLLSQAGAFCEVNRLDAIALATLKGNPFPDATPRFFKAMESALKEAVGRRIRILVPYAKLTKAQVARRVPGLRLDLTFSCIKPRGQKHCGKCTKCFERGLVI